MGISSSKVAPLWKGWCVCAKSAWCLGLSVGLVLLAAVALAVSPSAARAATTGSSTAIITDFNYQPAKVYAQPPLGFDRMTASNADLESYGLPPRPAGDASSPAVQNWQFVIDHAQTCVAPDPVLGSEPHQFFNKIQAGYVVPLSDYPGCKGFSTAESGWYQPSVPPNGNYTNYKTAPAASFWVGIQGTSNPVYGIQCGCDSISTSTVQYRCFTEDYPQVAVYEGPVVHAGDDLNMSLDYSGGYTGYFMENITTSTYSSFNNRTPYYGGKQADFLDERVPNNLYLPNFGTAFVWGSWFGDQVNSYQLLIPNDEEWIMTSDGTVNGTLMAEPGPIDQYGNFTQYWDHT